jgi:hypothetical protein
MITGGICAFLDASAFAEDSQSPRTARRASRIRFERSDIG